MNASRKATPWDNSEVDEQSDTAHAIIKRLGKRDTAALVDLHQLFGAPLFSYALKLLNNRSDAEESLQDSYVRIWEKAGKFDRERGKPFTWCCMILRGCCIDKLRHRNAAKRGPGNIIPLESGMIAEPAAARSHEADVQADWNERVEQVHDAMHDLHPLEKKYIEEAVFRGRTHHEIADRSDEPLGTVKSRIRRGMLKLRKSLSKSQPPSQNTNSQP